jgi:hypothetical protein
VDLALLMLGRDDNPTHDLSVDAESPMSGSTSQVSGAAALSQRLKLFSDCPSDPDAAVISLDQLVVVP